MRIGIVVVAGVVALSGCSGGPPTDAPAVAVSEAHASVASLSLAVRLRLDERSTAAYTQVMLQTSRDAVADAQRELAVADDADPGRRVAATPVVARAAAELSTLAEAGASALSRADLDQLVALEAELAGVSEDLGR